MNLPATEHVTLVEILKLTGTLEEFVEAAQAAARRLESEGIQTLVSVQFYANPGLAEVGAVLIFADPGEIMQHINMITAWDEFHRLIATVQPIEVRVHGRLSAEAEEWLRKMNVVGKTFTNHVAGFVR